MPSKRGGKLTRRIPHTPQPEPRLPPIADADRRLSIDILARMHRDLATGPVARRRRPCR